MASQSIAGTTAGGVVTPAWQGTESLKQWAVLHGYIATSDRKKKKCLGRRGAPIAGLIVD